MIEFYKRKTNYLPNGRKYYTRETINTREDGLLEENPYESRHSKIGKIFLVAEWNMSDGETGIYLGYNDRINQAFGHGTFGKLIKDSGLNLRNPKHENIINFFEERLKLESLDIPILGYRITKEYGTDEYEYFAFVLKKGE
ncbi:hypothetical protein [Gloeothece verrucosa]|uniref:Uncharacterized protein n=1 Tax=Gloeothece verrucosa (strain PCC 7822) TaxID=497965 RepID=E0UCA8_GLOV7|nr:hypothetical protein [Gloeothece verrucosa]ADN12865.1 hypothetical protein Cyan7822_0845 [Gloeothece verrucosa PCC 7822]